MLDGGHVAHDGLLGVSAPFIEHEIRRVEDVLSPLHHDLVDQALRTELFHVFQLECFVFECRIDLNVF